jgi:putative flippase GtrA
MLDRNHFRNIVSRADKVAGTSIQSVKDSWPEQGRDDGRAFIANRSYVLMGRGYRPGSKERAFLSRLSKFLLVGGTGLLVNSLALFILYQWAHLSLIVASALAVELAVINNFFWNDHWTFGRRDPSLGRFVRFNLVSLGGLAITTFTLWVLVHYLGLYYLVANLLGIALGTVWSFAANSLWTWGGAQ